jgi:hypothetical protein
MPPIQFLRRCYLVLACIPSVVLADPAMVAQALLKLGSCPSGYATSGGYCVPGRHARVALAKRGPCPSGYATSGAYCLAGAQARPAIPKVGPCPSGWSTSAGYCLRR